MMNCSSRRPAEERLIGPARRKTRKNPGTRSSFAPTAKTGGRACGAVILGNAQCTRDIIRGRRRFSPELAKARVPTMMYCHKTRFATLDGRQVDLRQPALQWLETKGFLLRFPDFHPTMFF